jgi:hypothetical protein
MQCMVYVDSHFPFLFEPHTRYYTGQMNVDVEIEAMRFYLDHLINHATSIKDYLYTLESQNPFAIQRPRREGTSKRGDAAYDAIYDAVYNSTYERIRNSRGTNELTTQVGYVANTDGAVIAPARTQFLY